MALYQHELTGRPLSETLGSDPAPFAVALAEAVVAHREELDALIAGHSHGWSVERINPLERAIMRVALLEMLHPELLPGEAPIPAEGAIEEAVRAPRRSAAATRRRSSTACSTQSCARCGRMMAKR